MSSHSDTAWKTVTRSWNPPARGLGGVDGERLGDEDSGVVDQGVDASETRECFADDPVGGCGLGDVSLDGEHGRVLGGLDRKGVGDDRLALRALPGDEAAPVP